MLSESGWIFSVQIVSRLSKAKAEHGKEKAVFAISQDAGARGGAILWFGHLHQTMPVCDLDGARPRPLHGHIWTGEMEHVQTTEWHPLLPPHPG